MPISPETPLSEVHFSVKKEVHMSKTCMKRRAMKTLEENLDLQVENGDIVRDSFCSFLKNIT